MAAKLRKQEEEHVKSSKIIKMNDERQTKIRMKNERMAERANYRRQKWLDANSMNDGIALSK